jgi:hypothetical protein
MLKKREREKRDEKGTSVRGRVDPTSQKKQREEIKDTSPRVRRTHLSKEKKVIKIINISPYFLNIYIYKT